MKRMHIHISVNDLPVSIRFYTAMFGNTEPTVVKDDYCKWMLQDPPVNFAISRRGATPGIDHLGIQVETEEELAEMNRRFAAADLPVQTEMAKTCCYSRSDKAWTIDPQGVAWETFRTLASAPVFGESRTTAGQDAAGACCSPTPSAVTFQRHR